MHDLFAAVPVCVPAPRWKDVSAGRLDWDTFLEVKRQELKRLNKIYRENVEKCVAGRHMGCCPIAKLSCCHIVSQAAANR